MALINPIHGDMSGSVGDNVFSHNRGGTYVRRRAIPVNPNSTKQQAARAALGTFAGTWATLTLPQQQAWTDWAALNPVVNRLGLSQILSGFGAYIQCNSRLFQAGATTNVGPPVGTGPAAYITLTPTMTVPGTISMAYTTTPMAAGERMLLWMTLPGTKGRNGNMNQARLVGYSAAAAASPISFTTPYVFASGNQFNLFVQRMNAAGQVSVPQKIVVTIP